VLKEGAGAGEDALRRAMGGQEGNKPKSTGNGDSREGEGNEDKRKGGGRPQGLLRLPVKRGETSN